MTDPALGVPSRPARVLVVEDDEALRLAVTRTLVKAGYEVVLAQTGAAAVAAAGEGPLDAAVVDVFLPDAGGLGVARELRGRGCTASVPVLFVTGLAIPAVREALAPSPVLFKPFSKRQLLAGVRRLAGSSEARRAA
jgi:DNA-binding response OmpR family regulator